MLARCSKYDFWIPGEILDWYRKNPHKNKNNSRSKKTCRKKSEEKIETETFSKNNFGKVDEKWKFRNFGGNFEYFFEIWEFSFFIDFFIDFFSRKIFGLEKYFFDFFEKIFWSRNFLFLCGFFFYINRKFSQESKNHT